MTAQTDFNLRPSTVGLAMAAALGAGFRPALIREAKRATVTYIRKEGRVIPNVRLIASSNG